MKIAGATTKDLIGGVLNSDWYMVSKPDIKREIYWNTYKNQLFEKNIESLFWVEVIASHEANGALKA
jgi:hypothetical protein